MAAAAVTCAACGTPNEPGRKFCGECGAPLAVACPACGTPNQPGTKFCGECGSPLAASTPAPAAPAAERAATAAAERRLVSVLFADLVGHTSFSEGRDAEEVRDLLSRYFERSRTVIERYGGTVEKFIGDAVMAVWGTPVAREDDAERAVRAALDLVDAVSALGSEVGASELQARAGVLTGEAAVTLAAEGEGMVAGDLVNTASRIQTLAEPGTVLVGEATKRASEAAIAYEDAGSHELKGKAEPVQVFRALRVIGLRRGAARAAVLEPPFVGRERELRLVKELFHASAEDRRAHLVSVVGIGGIGKSRLAWEFEKYIDGLAGGVWWHAGRCLAYGDGVAFWALAEMVRGRAGILEDEEAESARTKLRTSIEEHVGDPQERRFVEPRLAHLLGLEEGAVGDQENLFAAARMFFERLAQTGPTVLLFEDLHWADSALLDFVEYLVEWSRDVPLFVLTLSRPELQDRRPTWGSGKRNFTSIFLDPLAPDAMEMLLTGPVPGLPEELRERILERAEGVPFYAVETVRMLLDRGILVREDGSYRLAGEVETLEVPETLQALIAARLDGLAPEERRIAQQASVLGRTFTLRGLASVSGLAEAELEPLLASLVRKEVVSLQSDPLSPERGQYGFLQDLVKKVAYDTLSRKDRKTLHLAAAEHLRSLGEEDEIVEVIASHYLDAYRAAPDEPDAEEVKSRALDMLARSAERTASLGANAEAMARFLEAASLATDDHRRAELVERAGLAARADGQSSVAIEHYQAAVETFERAGDVHAAARVSARLGEAMWDMGRLDDAVDLMERSFAVVAQEPQDADLATLAAQLGRVLYFSGETQAAAERLEVALDAAESLWLPEVLSEALNTKSLTLLARGRPQECLALLEYALKIALEADIPSAVLRAYYNLAELSQQFDKFDEARDYVRRGIELARRVGNRGWERRVLLQLYPFYALGEWDELLRAVDAVPDEIVSDDRAAYVARLLAGGLVHLHRGEIESARQPLEIFAASGTSADVQERATYAATIAAILNAEGNHVDALQAVEEALASGEELGRGSEGFREGFVVAVDSALALGELDRAQAVLDELARVPRGKVPAYLRAHAARFAARIAALRGGGDPEAAFKRAASTFREISTPFPLAVTLLEHAEWLTQAGRAAEAEEPQAEAAALFERLGAVPWLARTRRLTAAAQVPA
ncbi:MAG TPA: adenylate/guanylate cyclase domain-containing protein [Gaiellaceae bacterium]|nr:adenylate/guanylate cyclase domain-containing protein [Gaiellaceae bacterium]